jgi:hypothetical protein
MFASGHSREVHLNDRSLCPVQSGGQVLPMPDGIPTAWPTKPTFGRKAVMKDTECTDRIELVEPVMQSPALSQLLKVVAGNPATDAGIELNRIPKWRRHEGHNASKRDSNPQQEAGLAATIRSNHIDQHRCCASEP